MHQNRRNRRGRTLATAGVAAVAMWLAAGTATAAVGDITTVAGTTLGFSGDTGPATAAQLGHPRSVTPTADGGYLIADIDNERIRKVAADGTITTVAGTGVAGYTGDGGPATAATLNFPTYVASLPGGGFLIADEFNDVIRKVDAGGTITTVAGTGVAGFSGDGGPATSAQLRQPRAVYPTADGGFLISDEFNDRVRKVSPGGTITTVAGTGVPGFSGDGGAATSAQLQKPVSAIPTPDGGFLIADKANHRVRKVSVGGTITTIAGNGTPGFAGDGGPATTARLSSPRDMAVAADGSTYIVDSDNSRVRRVLGTGTIITIAGLGSGLSGDGGPATAARMRIPRGMTIDGAGDILVADTDNHRVRRIDLAPADTTAPTVTARQPAAAATGVPTSTRPVVTFSEGMDPGSITTATLTIAPAAGGPALPAAVVNGPPYTSATVDPAAALSPGVQYRVTVGGGVKDLAGNPLGADDSWTFTTAAAAAGGGAFLESAGQVVMEAENFTETFTRNNKTWNLISAPAGFGGTGLMEVGPNAGNSASSTNTAELRFPVQFATAGTYQVWVRGNAISGSDDSLHIGLDNALVTTSDNITSFSPYGTYKWSKATVDGPVATMTVTAGLHTINLYMREDGMRVDRILLTTDGVLVPSGVGPAESPRA